MTERATCPTCHAPLPEGVDLGVCPRCLLAAGLETAEAQAGAAAPDIDEIAPLFPQLEINGLVGQGGMGVVYRARQKGLDRLVALKLLPASLADDPAFADRFQREARTMARLDHPHIVRVHDFGRAEGRFYLMMELVNGPNLREVIDRGGLTPQEALRIVPAICDALQYAHDQGVVHRDIKPENVLLDRNGRVKITDFGLAKLVHREADERTLTRAGQIMGTPHYMAPEQYRTPDHVDHRADIYSLGVVFYEMLTGEVPMGHFEPPSRRVEVDVRLDEVVFRALAREPEKRYQRAEEVRTRVTSIAETPAPTAPSAGASSPEAAASAGPKARRLSRLALCGFLATISGLLLPIVAAAVLAATDSAVAAAPLGVISFALVLTGFVVSLVGWIRCAVHRDEIRGLGLAIPGTLLPVVLLPLAFGWLLLAPLEAPRPQGPRTSGPVLPGQVAEEPRSMDEVEVEIRETWGELRSVLRRLEQTPADLKPFVDLVGGKRVAAARPEDLARMCEDEVLGLAGLDLGGDDALRDLEVTEVEPRPDGTVNVALAKDDGGVVVPMRKEEGHWRFVVGPVARLPLRTATWNTPDLLQAAPLDLDSRRVVQTEVELLFSAWQQCWASGEMPLRSRVPRGTLPWLLAPSEADSWTSLSSEELARRGAAGGLGLLFLDAGTLAVDPDELVLTSIDLEADARRGVATAATPQGAALRFHVVQEQGHWWLTLEPVERAG